MIILRRTAHALCRGARVARDGTKHGCVQIDDACSANPSLARPAVLPFENSIRHLSNSSNYIPSNHTTSTTAWERAAARCKDPREQQRNPYIAEIRTAVQDSPAMHLKTLQDELQSAIGQALGKQGQKVVRAIEQVYQELQLYEALLQERDDARRRASQENTTTQLQHDTAKNSKSLDTRLQESRERYHLARQRALTARWELLVHRQAAGFVVRNHETVMQTFVIPGPLLEESE